MRRVLKATLVIIYTAALIGAILGAAEYTARVMVHAGRGTTGAQPELLLDRWAGFRNNPSYRRTGIRHTAEGFRRDQDVSLEKPPNTVRIFLMGGSVAYGAGTLYPEIESRWRIDDHQTIDHYLELRLNATLPAKRWEVINAAVKAYMLHQDLGLILSVILRYHPDYVILLDGQNDLLNLLRAPPHYDAYRRTQLADEFDALTNPRSLSSLGVMLSTWLTDNSVLYRVVYERMQRRVFLRARSERARALARELTPEEQTQYRITASQLDHYTHVVGQIHRILAMDGVQDIFLLQPQLLVTRKTLTGSEPRLSEYHRAVAGPLVVHGFETLYPELGNLLAADSQKEGYRFLNLTAVFDRMRDQAFTDECHLTPAGNHRIADAIFEFLETSFRDRALAFVSGDDHERRPVMRPDFDKTGSGGVGH